MHTILISRPNTHLLLLLHLYLLRRSIVGIDNSRILKVIELRLGSIPLPQEPSLEPPRELLSGLELSVPARGDTENVVQLLERSLLGFGQEQPDEE